MRRTSPNRIRLEFQGRTLDFQLEADQPYALIATDAFEEWINSIGDVRTNARITKDVYKMRRGLFGDWKEADGVFEMRLDYGPGYRVYYAKYGRFVIILLGGGDKGSQNADLRSARRLWEELKNALKEV